MSEQVKIYVRNSKKYGKVLNVGSRVSGQELYRLAAQSQGLKDDEVRLILGGKELQSGEGEVELKEKAIVHLINLREVNVDQIEVSIKPLYSRSAPIIVETNSQVTIQDFIDDKLFKAYGQKSDKLILVHIGRQLNLAKTFQEELIENHSELICANIDEIKQRKGEPIKPVQSEQPINVPIKDLQVPEQPKDIYPQPNFTIDVPVEVNATNNLQLIFDSKIRHSSSLPNCGLEPEEIIPEEEFIAKESQGVEEEVKQEEKVQTVENVAAENVENFAAENIENVANENIETVEKEEEKAEEQAEAEVVTEAQQAKNEEKDERDESL